MGCVDTVRTNDMVGGWDVLAEGIAERRRFYKQEQWHGHLWCERLRLRGGEGGAMWGCSWQVCVVATTCGYS